MNAIAGDFVSRLERVRYINREVNDLRMEVGKWSMENAGMLVFDRRLGCLEDEATETERMARRMVEANAKIFKVRRDNKRKFASKKKGKKCGPLSSRKKNIRKNKIFSKKVHMR